MALLDALGLYDNIVVFTILFLSTWISLLLTIYLYNTTKQERVQKRFTEIYKYDIMKQQEKESNELAKFRYSFEAFQDFLDKRLERIEKQPNDLKVITSNIDATNKQLANIIEDIESKFLKTNDSDFGKKISNDSLISIYKQVSSEFTHGMRTELMGIETTISSIREILPQLLQEKGQFDQKISIDLYQMLDNAALSIEYIQDFLKNGAGFSAGKPEEFNIYDLVKKAVRLAKIGTNSKANISISLPDIPKIEFYPLNLLIPLITLIENSIDATNSSGKINITGTYNEMGEINLCVSNNGTPIMEDIKTKLFKEKVSTKGATRGFGLIGAKHCIQSVGGDINLVEASDTCTKFCISFNSHKT